MIFKMINGLPIASIPITYHTKTMIMENVLIDTGCANTIFDTDTIEEIGLTIDPTQGKATYMYGVGGRSEVCFQQNVEAIQIDSFPLKNFVIQLGMTTIPYGFNALLGSDFFVAAKLRIDFSNYEIY